MRTLRTPAELSERHLGQLKTRRRELLARATAICCEMLEGRQLMSGTYYVNNSGSDSNPGTQALPWQTISKVNSVNLTGDTILFEGGQTFTSPLNDSSYSNVTISTYGTGNAIFQAPNGNSINNRGMLFNDVGGISISNITIKAGTSSNANGIKFNNDGSTNYSGVTLNNVNISGFGVSGLEFDSTGSTTAAGFSNISVTDSSFSNNIKEGLFFGTNVAAPESPTSPNNHTYTNITVTNCDSFDNNGVAGGYSGGGFAFQQCSNALVQFCVAHDNGLYGTTGSIAFITAESDNVTFTHNEAFNEHTQSGDPDGGGFDFDFGTTNSTMEYNYSHDNDGHGFQLDNPKSGLGYVIPGSGDVVRYNVGENNGRKNSRTDLDVWGQVTDASIYNNTIYESPVSSTDSSPPIAVGVHNVASNASAPSDITFTNNVFQTSQYPKGSTTEDSTTVELIKTDSINSSSNVNFDYDDLSTTAAANFKIEFEGSTYSSFTAWKTSGQDTHGLNVAPGLIASGAGVAGSAAAYKTTSSSPLISAGATISGAVANTADYFGVAIPASSPTIGASQYLAMSHTDLGGSTPAGSTTADGTGYDLTAGGANGINGTTDQAQYVYQQRTGDFDSRTQVTSLTGPSTYSAGGLMAREGVSSGGEREVSMTATRTIPTDGSSSIILYFKYRDTTNGATTQVALGLTLPAGTEPWLRLVRSGNTFTGYYSTDGYTWTAVGSETFTTPFSNPCDLGLGLTSRTSSGSASGQFAEFD